MNNEMMSEAEINKTVAEHKKQLLLYQQNRKNSVSSLEDQLLNDEKILNDTIMSIINEKDFDKTNALLIFLNKVKNNTLYEINELNQKKQRIDNAIITLNDSLNRDDYAILINLKTRGAPIDIKYDEIKLDDDTYNLKIYITIKDKCRIHITNEFNRLLILKIKENNGKIINYNIQYDISKINVDTNTVIGHYYLTK